MTMSARLVVDRLAVAGCAPGVGDTAAVRGAREVVDVAASTRGGRVVGDERVDRPSGAP